MNVILEDAKRLSIKWDWLSFTH